MANEFRKVKDANGVYHPVTDDNRVDWASYAKTGVHNFLPDNIKTETIGSLTITDNKGELTVNGSTSSDVDRYYIGIGTTGWEYTNMPTGDYTIACDNTDQLPNGYRFIVAEEGTGTIASVYSVYPSQNFHLDTTKRYRIFMRFASGSYDNVKLHPIVKLQSDTDTSWTPNAMTNQELTEKVTQTTSVLTISSNSDLPKLKNGINAVKFASGMVIGTGAGAITLDANYRGYIVRDDTTLNGIISNFDGANIYFIASSDNMASVPFYRKITTS